MAVLKLHLSSTCHFLAGNISSILSFHYKSLSDQVASLSVPSPHFTCIHTYTPLLLLYILPSYKLYIMLCLPIEIPLRHKETPLHHYFKIILINSNYIAQASKTRKPHHHFIRIQIIPYTHTHIHI